MLDKLPADLALQGRHVRLEAMQMDHRDALMAAAADGELWDLRVTAVPDASAMDNFIETAIENRLLRVQHPFVVRRLEDDLIVGTTRYYDIDATNLNLSIGHTWYAQSAQRSAVNTECKLLLLSYAFEELGVRAVFFHTHHENFASQRAIERLGALRDGVIRRHRIMADGSNRDTVCYSIIEPEWPELKTRLEARLR